MVLVVDIHIPSFNGQSYLQYMGMRRALLAFAHIQLVFKATDPDGLILYNGYATDGTGDFISLALRNGTLEYRFDLGTGPAVIRYTQLASCLINAQPLPAHSHAANDNSLIGCTSHNLTDDWSLGSTHFVDSQYPFRCSCGCVLLLNQMF